MSHLNWPRILLFDLAHKHCNSMMKRWPHCLTSDVVWLNMMPGHGANPIVFNKKNKNWTSRTLVNPLRPITSHFCLTSSTHPLKLDVICVSPLILFHKRRSFKNFLAYLLVLSQWWSLLRTYKMQVLLQSLSDWNYPTI